MSASADVGYRAGARPEDRDLTWAEYLDLPDDDRYRHAELVNGRLVLVNPPKLVHQEVVGSLHALIWMWIRAGQSRGRVTLDPPVRIADRRAYLPDVAWFREENANPGPGEKHLTAAPDLAIEVLSDSTRQFDLVRKRRDYAAVGVRELWIIDPESDDSTTGVSAVILRRPSTPTDPPEFVVAEDLEDSETLSSPLLPGLAIPLGSLVAR